MKTLFVFTSIVVTGLIAPSPVRAVEFEREVVDQPQFGAAYTSVDFDSRGHAHISYQAMTEVGQFLGYATQAGGGWTLEIVDSNSSWTGVLTSIEVDANDVPHIGYWDGQNQKVMHAVKTGDTWILDEVDDSAVDVTSLNLEIASDGKPHVAWGSATTQQIEWSQWTGASWFAQVATSECWSGNMAFALDAIDRPHISYHYQDAGLRYLKLVGLTFVDHFIYATGVPQRIAVDTDAYGNFHSLYHHTSSGTPLYQTVRSPGHGQGGTYESYWFFPDGGDHLAIVVDDNDRPHGAFTGEPGEERGDLYYAVEVDSGWVSTSVDYETDSCGWVSIALDPQGNPGISYVDINSGQLRFADAGIDLVSPSGGDIWPVGAERTIAWSGVGPVDILLSTDGGSTYEAIEENVIHHEITFRVPHTPSRYVQLRIERTWPAFATAEVDSFITVQSEISASKFRVASPSSGIGRMVSWETDPGPEDLQGYRLERRRGAGNWNEIMSLSRHTSHHDPGGDASSTYRLMAVNGLGEERQVGEVTGVTPVALSAWPQPYSAGALNVTFGTLGSFGGGPGEVEVALYDVTGRRVRLLHSGALTAGVHQTTWDGRTITGQLAPAGVYFLRSASSGQVHTEKIMVVR